MKRKTIIYAGAFVVAVMGCVTIPDTFEARIYIDIRHIEDQAEKALDYVEGKTDAPPVLDAAVTEAPAQDKQSRIRRTLEWLSPIQTAYAQELEEASPRAQQILAKMKERFPEIERVKKTGAVGENNRGLVELVKPDLLTTDEAKNDAQRVIAAENEDRKAYYQEIARLNKDANLKVGTVESVYAQKRLERAQPGELVQLPPAGEHFDAFKATDKGKKLGGELAAGAWVVIK